MKAISRFFIIFLIIGCTTTSTDHIISKDKYTFSTLSFLASDNVRVFADYYSYNGKNAPLILMYHQAGFSRGAFRNIAPQLVDKGFNVLAVDLRSGEQFNKIANLTHIEAKNLKKPTEFVNSIIDMEASLEFAKTNLTSQKIILWGSSYSASLGFYMAAKHPNDYKALIAFSPGEYFKIDNKTISDYASQVQIPVFVSSAKSEASTWQPIYDHVKTKKSSFLPTKTEGRHGTLALSDAYIDAPDYWRGIRSFLEKLR